MLVASRDVSTHYIPRYGTGPYLPSWESKRGEALLNRAPLSAKFESKALPPLYRLRI